MTMGKLTPPPVIRQIAPTTCKNCGAPLHDGKCEYCGTEYNDNHENRKNDN